jgi:Phthiocerol/phthiodiolone dimycocerosyl transferase C-terminus
LPTSAIFSPEIKPAQSVNATKLRDLDTFEEFFWLLEQSAPLFHAVVAEVNGATTIQQWKNALDAIQIHYPLLSASIRKVPGKRPFFQKVEGVSVPLRIAPLTDSLVVEEEMEKELQQPFGDGSGQLTRAVLFYSPGRSVVIFATHHSSLDGKSHLLLVQDLLASVAGEDLGKPLEVLPGLGQLLGLPTPAEYEKKLEGRSVAPEDGAPVEMPQVSLQRLQLTVEETKALLQRAREEGTTVHAALVTALTLAGKRYSEKWKMGPVRCTSPIDMRKALNIPDAVGMLVSLHHAPVLTPDEALFWDIARTVRKEMLPAQSADGARQLLDGMSSSMSDELTARDLYWSVLNGPRVHELMVTNYAGYQVRSEYGDLKIENLFTGSPSIMPALQKVSVLTVNGRLGMTLVARDIFPTLLEDAREILTRVVHPDHR